MMRATILLSTLALAPTASAQDAEARAKDLKTFVVDPAPAPRPTFRYRLLPPESERTPGNAAPVYERLGLELNPDGLKAISDNTAAWMDRPAAEFPVAEARKFVDAWRSKTEQLDFGARRTTCDWSYTIPEQRERIFEVLLPDVQGMRNWARLLAIKGRVEALEGRFDEAIRTSETGLAFARHVGEGPFLINSLVGIAFAQVTLHNLEELATRPGAPNLYWALTALPRPLIDLRDQTDLELRFGENMVPELADLDAPRSEAEWSSLYLRMVARLAGLAGYYQANIRGPGQPAPQVLDAAAFRARYLDQARRDLERRPAWADDLGLLAFVFKDAHVDEARRAQQGRPDPAGPMNDDRALVLLVASHYREMRDLVFRASYLPFPESAAATAEAEARVDAETRGPAGNLALLMPAVMAAHKNAVKLDRRVAALRVVEALRLHASADGGRLPKALADVTVVPIPPDPVTGKPFEYRLEGDTAVLTGAGDRVGPPSIHYRVTIRK